MQQSVFSEGLPLVFVSSYNNDKQNPYQNF